MKKLFLLLSFLGQTTIAQVKVVPDFPPILQKRTTNKITLDSMVGYNDKFYLKYNDEGMNIEQSRFLRNGKVWIKLENSFINFDSLGRKTSYLTYHYQSPGKNFVLNFQTDYTYGDNGKLRWITDLAYNSTNLQMDTIRKYFYAYDSSGHKLLSRKFERYGSNTWGETKDTIFAYSRNSLIKSYQVVITGLQSNYEISREKTDLSYDTLQNLTESNISVWDPNRLKWFVNYKSIFTYNQFDLLLQKTTLVAYEDTMFRQINKTEYTYDNNQNLISDLSYNFSQIRNDWEKDDSYDKFYKYDSVRISEVSIPKPWYYPEFKNRLISVKTASEFLYWNMFYSDQIITSTNKMETLNMGITVYPNPVIDYLIVEGSEKIINSKIVDINGQEIPCKIESETKINVDLLRPGQYILKVIFPASEQNFKIVKN